VGALFVSGRNVKIRREESPKRRERRRKFDLQPK
jgi:hypothetical protein